MEYKLDYINDEMVRIDNMDDLILRIRDEKTKIDENPKKWSIIKKIINEYEYIYTSPNPNKNIAAIYPYSRSYFKMKEIINDFEILKDSKNVFCIAEAPGGFIQCLLEYNVKIVATTLLSKDKKIPYWNKNLITDNDIFFQYGIKGNGDITDISNLLSMIKNNRNYYNTITADGGFDYSVDYNNQEKDSLKLIKSEIFLAVNTQKIGGSFICKLFDIFLKETIHQIYILSLLYEDIYFYKPSISRLSNSEKYIICNGYKGYNKELINILFRGLIGDIDYKCSKDFLNNIRIYNEYYSEKQINKISQGIKLFDGHIKSYPTEEKINKTLEWCIKNKIKINHTCYYLNSACSK